MLDRAKEHRLQVVLAEFVSPFPFAVEVSPAGTRLMGGVPDETAHADLLLASAAADDELRLLSGAPQRERWLAAARFALDFAARLEQGSARLDDLALSLEGRAATLQAYDQLRREVVDALAAAVRDAYPRLSHRYYAMKAKWLGTDKLMHWDRNAPLPEHDDRTIPWPEAEKIVLDAYNAFSPELAEVGRKFFGTGWIDAPAAACICKPAQLKNLRSAKASTCFSPHPSTPIVLTRQKEPKQSQPCRPSAKRSLMPWLSLPTD